jgi:isopenicillin N synthase-like dioxygenase
LAAKEAAMTVMSVPVINLAPWFEGTPAGKAEVAKQVDAACRSIGFLVITEHGINPQLITRVGRASERFFAMPLTDKRKVDRPRPDAVRGYSAVGEEGLSYSLEEAAPGDLKESFSMGPPRVVQDEYHIGPQAGTHFATNVFPPVDDFEACYTEYFDAMSALARELMCMFAVALKLPETFFDDKINEHISMFRVLSYPPQTEPPLPGQLRAGAHSDYGSLTIVMPDGPGLQVQDKSGQWLDVPFIPGAYVVNIADLMMQWTNDNWVSTLHRVANPPFDDSKRNIRRQSLVFFHQPNYDAMIECLPVVLGAGETPKYEPVSSGDHLMAKFLKQTTFGGTKATA